MRFTPLAISGLILLGTASSSFAQETHGLNKHDASIARYNYTVPIQIDESPDAGSLQQDLDKGNDNGNVTPSPAPRAKAPLSQPSTMPMGQMPMSNAGNIVNTTAANFSLPSVQGANVSLNDTLAKGPTLLLFVRNSSSPYSLQQLQLMQKNLQQFGILGIQVLAVTSEPMSGFRTVQQRYNFSFPIVSDPSNAIARRYGLAEVTQPVPALLSINKQSKIVAVQTQPQRSAVFDLAQATAPLRQASTQASIPAPTPAAAPEMMAVDNDPVLDQPAEMLSDTNDDAPVMPPVPSPRSTKAMQVPDSVPKIKYSVPPSNPAFKAQFKTVKLLSV